jgi:hypothetical protein
MFHLLLESIMMEYDHCLAIYVLFPNYTGEKSLDWRYVISAFLPTWSHQRQILPSEEIVHLVSSNNSTYLFLLHYSKEKRFEFAEH